MLTMTADAPANEEKHVTSNIEFECSHRNTSDAVLILTQMTLCVTMLHTYPTFAKSNVISDGPTNWLPKP